MVKQKSKPETNSFPGSVPMAGIDGAKIRRLRESKGLTQLYLSTVVGVTTDTISRWENRKYPSIKLENAEKLAQALEVELHEILEQEESAAPQGAQGGIVTAKPELPTPASPFNFRIQWIIACVAATFLIVFFWFFSRPEQLQLSVTAERILPLHVPAGQSFPVLILVQTIDTDSVSLILKELIPPGCKVTYGKPDFTTVDTKNNAIKWISRTATEKTVFAYIVTAPYDAAEGKQLVFDGSVTLKQQAGTHEEIRGEDTLTVAPFHWADTNRDKIIDDEEILSVYDVYSSVEGLRLDRDMIDSIWAGSGYYWDRAKGQYIIQN